MKKFNKILVLILALTLTVSAMCISAFAASASSSSTKAGEQGTVTFTFDSVVGVDGSFDIGDGIIIDEISNNAYQGDVSPDSVYLSSAEPTTITITIKYTVASDAAAGTTPNIKFSGREWATINGDANSANTTANITVSSTTPSTPSLPSISFADTTELKAQIAIAEALKETDYTVTTWEAMIKALNYGKTLVSSFNQAKVDEATTNLKATIAALVKIDRTALIDAMNKADALFNKNADTKLWKALADATANGANLMNSRTQADIDAGVTALLNAIKAVEELLAKGPETIEKIVEVEKIVEKPVEVIKEVEKVVEKEVIKEVLVEVPAEGSNLVWIILLVISIVINVGLAVLVVLYFIKKKNNQKDNTPLVDYNIEEDDNK